MEKYKLLCIRNKPEVEKGKFYDAVEKDGLIFVYEQDTNIEVICWGTSRQEFRNSFAKYFVKLTIQERRRKIIEDILKL